MKREYNATFFFQKNIFNFFFQKNIIYFFDIYSIVNKVIINNNVKRK